MESNFPVARFLDMPRRIAQERVPTAPNVGSRDVTWASQPHLSSPSRLFSSFAGSFEKKKKKGSHGGHGVHGVILAKHGLKHRHQAI